MTRKILPMGITAAGEHSEDSKSDVLIVSFDDLKRATNNFAESNKLGNGGFGEVYRGNLGGTEVAVKVLRTPGNADQEKAFHHEVDILSKMKHQHLIRLIGVCPEKFATVYEFMPGGTLEEQLVKRNLSWIHRFHIASEICDALSFLHSANPKVVVHGDVKPGNVLLDGSGRSKLIDFGVSRFMPISITTTTVHHTTIAKGSLGYMDLALCQNGKLTPSADVYSFGMTLLRLLTKEKPGYELISIVRDALEAQNIKNLLDTKAEWPYQIAGDLSKLALKCCNYPVKARPDISVVREVLLNMKQEYIDNKVSCLELKLENSKFSSSKKLEFSYSELQEATSNFSNASKLGQVVNGEMYQGKLRDKEVAIHILFRSDDELLIEAFLQEVNMLESMRHPHIVQFIGTCMDKYALVYDCIIEGTLEERLIRKDLLWQDRIRIATEICSAIKFIQDQKPDILINGDFPLKNVVLDASGRSMLYNFTANGKEVLPLHWFGTLLLHLLANDRDLDMLLAVGDNFKLANAFRMFLDHSAEWPSKLAEELFDLARRCCYNSVEGSSKIAVVLDQLIEMNKSYIPK